MKRYYSHYIFIYPDIYLKNHIVELDSLNRIIDVFPYEKEVEKTEFYVGWLYFIPQSVSKKQLIHFIAEISLKKEEKYLTSINLNKLETYTIYDNTGHLIL